MNKFFALFALALLLAACTPEPIIEYVEVERIVEVEVEVIREVEVEVIVEVTPEPAQCLVVYDYNPDNGDCYLGLWGAEDYLGEVFYNLDDGVVGYNVAGDADPARDRHWDAVSVSFYVMTANLWDGDMATALVQWENSIIELAYDTRVINGLSFTVEYFLDEGGMWAVFSWPITVEISS